MAVSNDFSASELDLNGQVAINSPTALVWGVDGRLYVTEVDGDVKILTVAFGDKDPADDDPTASFHVTAAETVGLVKAIQNHNDDGSISTGSQRQVTGIDVTPQFDADGNPVMIDGKPAVVMYVTSSDSRIGAGGSGNDANLDTNSGVITRLVQTEDGWDAVDIVRGLARSEENHATNGLEVIQEIDPDTGMLISERMIVANGGNANTGAPSNNFAGQQEQPLSAAILEIDLDEIRAIEAADGLKLDNGRAYVYDLPTLDDPTRDGDDANDPFGGNDGVNSAKLIADGPVQIYSAGYRNAYDVEVTEDGRVWTYDNGANNNWGGRPAGEDSDGDTDSTEAAELAGPPEGYIATNLFVEDNSEIAGNYNPQNWDQMHEITRSDDLNGRSLSAGLGGALTYQWDHPDFDEPLTLVYGGHANPTRAEGSRAGILYTPTAGVDGAKLMVSNLDRGDGRSDFLDVVEWFQEIGYTDAFIANTVVALNPGTRYADEFVAGYTLPTTTGVYSLVEDASGPVGLPSDIAEIVHQVNEIEGDYREPGFTDGAIDTGKGSVNGLAEYTSSIFDDAGQGTMQGALFAASLNQGQYYIIGRDEDGIVQTATTADRTVAADKGFVQSGGAPLGVASIGDDLSAFGNNAAFQGSIWGAIYKQNGPVIEILQPGNADTNPLLGVNFYAGQEPFDPVDNDLDGVDHLNDPFEFDADNGLELTAGERLELNFSQVDLAANPEFSGTIGDTGLLGAALDGTTPNRDAITEADGAAPADRIDGLFDNAGNIIPGGNAPILQIKDVQDGTAIGAANTLRDGLHTGVRIADDVQRMVAEVDIANWWNDQSGGGRITGLTFGDGTQSNFIRFVFGDIGGQLGLELGVETGDSYAVLATVTDADFLTALTDGDAGTLRGKLVTLQLEISDIGGDYAISARYKAGEGASFTEVSVDAAVPAGVLRDVLDGTHTISDGDTTLPSGAAIGIVAQKDDGVSFTAVDFHEIRIEGFGNEIEVSDASAANAQAGTAGTDTLIYTGDDTAPVTLQPGVENIDASGTTGSFAITGNDQANVVTVGAGANTVTTGAGADVVRGTLADLNGDMITDFSNEDALLIEGFSSADIDEIGYSSGSLVLTINGQQITLDGENFADTTDEDAADRVNLTDTADGLRITARAPLEPVVAINAGGTGTFTGTLRDTTLTFYGDEGGAVDGPGFTTPGATKAYPSGGPGGFDFPGTDLDQLLGTERSNGSAFGYDIPVANGTYLIDFIFAEIYWGGGSFPGGGGDGSRVFDINVEGQVAFTDVDIHAEAGGNGIQLVKTYEVEVTDGTLNIEIPPASSDQGKLSGMVVWSTSGAYVPPPDAIAPVIEDISLENPQNFGDGERALTVVLTDETGFDIDDFAGLDGSEITFDGITPDAVSAPTVALSANGMTATLTYQVTGEGNAWVDGTTGTIQIDAGAFSDAGGNGTAAASAGFVVQSHLDALVRGEVLRAINIGTTDTTAATNLGGDPLDGGAVDNNRYGGAIAADSLITDAFGNPVAFEADNTAYHSSPKANGALNANVDGQSGSTGSNAGGIDLDGSAYHTYRDSTAGSWTSTFDGFANGTYVVELHFAELFQTAANTRVGDFTVNGVVFGDDYDAFAAAQGGAGADKPSFIRKAVTVTDGTIQVLVDDVSAGQPGYSAIVVYEALDPDLPPTLSVGDITVVEGETAEITITRLGDLSEAVTVDVALTPGTADAADIGAASATQVTFAANQTVATITLPIIDDDDEEGAETIGVTLSNATGSAVIANGTATITIAASDSGIQAPVGTTIFELDFEGGEGEAIAIGGFDGTLGDEALTLDETTSQVTGGKLVVQTAEGDINDGADNGSINDFTKTVDLSDPAMTEIYLTSRFDNPFTEDVLIAQGITDGRLPNYAQQGLVFGTGSQAAANMVKLVWGAVAAGAAAPDAMGVQMWSKAGGLDQKVLLADMLAEGLDQFDVASVEMSLVIDKAAGTVGQYVTLFDAAGTIIGGVRPVATAGFATAAPVGMPAAVLANLTSTTEATHVGVTSSDNSIGEGAFTSFEASWDFLRLSSPQYAGGPEPDADGPTASVSIEAPALDADPIVVSVAYADASDIDPATIDAGDVVLTGPTAPGAVTVAFDAETNVATYSFAAPEGGWAEGEYGATVAAAEVADLAASPNANTGGENAIATLSFEDEPVPEYTAGEIALAINAGGPAMTMEGIAFESGQGATDGPFFGGLIYTDPSTGSSGNGPQPIFDGTVYKTEINGNSDGDFTFSAAVDSEKLYFVDLYLAELYASLPGQRIFDVFVEGGAEPVLNDYDILAVNGGDINKPVVVRLATPIAPGENGQIDLSFVAVTDRAKVSAIVIREAVPVGPDTLISVSGPGEVLETGDGADQMVAFTLTASDAALTGDVDMTVQVDGVTSAVTVAFTDGVASFEVAVPTDTRWNGAEAVAFEVISVESEGISVDAGAAAATASVTEDDPADSHDLSDAADPVVAGDYSDDRLAPSDIGAMQQGENILYATQQGDAEPGARDRDYITFEVPEGMVLSALFLDGYVTTEVAGQAFMGLQVGNAVTVDPLTGEPDAGSEGLLAGIVYGDGNLNGDLLELLAAGDPSDAQGADFPGFDGVLTAGTYTLWLNQGGPSTSVTLRAVVEPAPIAALSLSIGDATVTEAEGASLDFAITTDQPFTGQIELTFDTATETGLTQIVDMTDGAGILSLPVADDDVDDGDEQIDLTITGAVDQAAADPVAITLADAVAVGTITEDDGIDPADIDGDGILNQDDPFAYDASNGMDRVLGEGVTFRQDFDTDTDDVFEAGFTGIIVNQGLDPAGMSADDPYGDRTTEGTSLVEDGVLKIESSETDLYDTGTGASNTVKDNYHSGVDVSDVDSFTIEGRVQGGWLGTVPQQYASFGITVGAGGTDDYVKFVISGFQTTPRLQLSNENSLTGAKEQNIILATQDPEIVEEDIASVIFRIEVDKSGDAPSLTATAILLDASDAELATISTGPRAIVGSLAAALEGNNPLTGGTGGIAYGVSITDWSNGAGNRFTGEWDYLEISGPEAADAPPVVDQGIAPQAIDEDAPFSFVIPEDAFADDGGAANLVLTATLAGGGALPDWLVFDPETGSFSGTPEQADVGQITVEVSASDGVNAPVATQFTLDVTEVNDAPTAAPIDAGSVAETGAPVAIDLLEGAADSDGGTLAVANVTATAGDPAQPVTVTQVDSVLTIDPAQFADLLATGESVSVTVAYEVTDGQGGVTANVATLLVEGLDGPFTWYVDADGDGYGLDDAATNQTGYDQPDGTAALAGDADDADATVYPGAPEIEDGKDNDQDGEIDEGFDEPAEVTPILFQAGDLSSYDRQDKNPAGAAISGDGSTLTLTGNTWKKLALAEAVTVEAGSVLRVTFSSDVATEISAVGLDTDSNLDTLPQALFTLAGTQDFAQGDQTYDTYQVGDGPVTFELSLDAWAGETFQYLVFVNDADSLNIGTANGVFSDVAIVGPGAVPNSAPVAVADSLTATEDTALSFDAADLAANDTDADGDALTVVSVTAGTGGTVALTDGVVTFTPDAGFTGTADFSYVVSDGTASSTGTATVTVEAADDPNSAPVAVADSLTATEDTALSFDAADLTANDTDADGDALTVVSVTAGTGGTVALTDGVVTFTPDAGFTGTADFSYVVSDGTASSTGTATVTVEASGPEGITEIAFAASDLSSYDTQDKNPAGATILDGGDALQLSGNTWKKLALPEPLTVQSDMVLRFSFSSDQIGEIMGIGFESDNRFTTDTANQALFQLAGSQTFGAYADQSFNTYEAGDGTVTVEIPLAGLAGRSFDYLVFMSDDDDGIGAISTYGNVQIVSTTTTNGAPTANDDAGFASGPGQPLVIASAALLGNDVDPDGDALSVTAVSGAVNGTVSLSGGQVTFTADAGFSGTASFDYTVSDGKGGTDTATVAVEVNSDPDAVDDGGIEIARDGTVYLTPAQLLANDTDADGQAISLVSVSNAVNGTVEFEDDQVTFIPAAGFTGTASFDYTIEDAAGGSDTATVTISVVPTLDPGAGVTDVVFSGGDLSSYSNQDKDPASASVQDGGNALQITGNSWKKLELPEPYAVTADTVLRVTIRADQIGEVIGIGLDNDNSFQQADQALFQLGGSQPLPAYFRQVPNDYDTAGQTVTYELDLSPWAGQTFSHLVLANDADAVTGDVTFSDVQLVRQSVTNANPTPADDALAAIGNEVTVIDPATLLANDGDPDGDALTLTGVSNATNGEVLFEDGLIYFTPDEGFAGEAGFDYTVADADGATATASVTLNVNRAPDAVTDTLETAVDTPIYLGADLLVQNDTDPDGDALTVTSVGGATGGTVVLDDEGQITFTPDAGFTGDAGFTYTVSDGRGGTDTGLATVTVGDSDPGPGGSGTEIDFSALPSSNYGGQSGDGTVASSADGSTLTIDGNTWNKFTLPEPVSVEADTVLRFDIEIPAEGEIIAIGLDNDSSFSGSQPLFQIAGSQLWPVADQSFAGEAGPGITTIEIPLAAFAGQSFQYLVLINDADRIDGTSAIFSNVVVDTPPDDLPPVFTSADTVSMAENQTAVATITAEDADSTDLTFGIADTGADDALFAIDADTGALSFVAAPDYENPTDADGDNVYEVDVTVSDGSSTVTQSVQVSVDDVAEATDDPEPLLRINAWGDAVAAIDGGPDWQADGNGNADSPYVVTGEGPGFNRGDTQGYSGDPGDIPAEVPQAVLNTARSADGDFSYAIPVGDLNGNGSYIVNLYLAELYGGNQAVGDRVFDISVEGMTTGILDNFDPSAPDAGGDLRVVSYEVTVTDGELNIGFVKDLVDGIDNPIINAIEIMSNPAAALDTDAPEAALTLTNPAVATDPILVEIALSDASGIDAASLGDDDLALSVNGFDVSDPPVTFTGLADGVATYQIAAPAGGWTDGTQIAVTLTEGAVLDLAGTPNGNEAASAGLSLDIGGGSTGGDDASVYRINAGGAFIAATDGGPDWLGDQPGAPNEYLRLTNPRDAADTGGTAAPGIDGVPDAIFSTARSSDGSFFYDIPVSELGGGENFEVRLYLAEVFPGAHAGDFRNFDASLEGFVPASFNNIDPGGLYGGGGGVLTAQVHVDDGVLNIGLENDLKQNPIINGIEIVALSTDVENPTDPVDPTGALEAFASQSDLAIGSTYAEGTIGSARLEVMTGNNNIQSSNYGSDSFEVTNTGDKKISAIFIDVTSALYQDSVFDPDGLGGDDAAKPWQVNSDGNTGAYISGSGYFLPGEDPIPNSGGSGGASNGGYKGAMVKFSATDDGGFTAGETVGFSGDMDPNSIAGMAKGDVDGSAILSWDVGGISGHELIGSLFTVLFDDGTTASGQLASDGSSAGSHTVATQAPGDTAPGIAVNGLNAGQNGTYGGTLPAITVTGNPGDLVQITLTKGFNPVTETDAGIADLVNDRLEKYDFKANNAFDAQSVTVTIGADGTFDASTLFDYDDAVNNNVGSGSFSGDDVQPIAFVATKVGSDGLPVGPTTQPIYLTNDGGPVVGDPSGGTGGGVEGYYQINGTGTAAYFKVQIEDPNANGGTNPGGKWSYEAAADGDGNQSGFDGDGYYLFGSNSSTGIDNNVGGNEMLEYTIYVPEGETGIYNFRVRASRDGTAAGDQQNDIWLNFKHAEDVGNGNIEEFLTETTDEAEPVAGGFVKVYGGPNDGSWGFASAIDGVPGNFNAQIEISEAGLYTVQLDGRSQGFHVDYWDLSKAGGSTPNASSADSSFIEGEPGDGGGSVGSGGIVVPVDATSDDWEERGGGTSGDLELGDNGGPQYVGIRFDGIDIPDGAVITEAFLRFEAMEDNSDPASFTIKIEDTENAAGYSSGSTPGGRSYLADEFQWNPEAWTDGETYETGDLSDLIEAVIGDDGTSDGAFGFLIEGDGSRVAHPFGSGGNAPELVINWEDLLI